MLRHASIIAAAFPNGRAWAAKHTDALADGDEPRWQDICKAAEYFRAHPKPWVYVRELPIGLHTKFVEQNSRIVISLLEIVAPDALNTEYSSWQDRLGLRSSSTLIEGRFLDPTIAPGFPQHLQAPIEEWNRCEFNPPDFILVVENRTTFLSLPDVKGGFALLGKGYAVALFADIAMLRTGKAYYWGDIDQHGFEILATFRSKVPSVQSLLMDMATVERFPGLRATESVEGTLQADFVLAHLSPQEAFLWRECVRSHCRLEQEHLPIACLLAAVDAARGARSTPSVA